MNVLHDRATFLSQYRRCRVFWVVLGATVGVAIGFNANPIFEPELLGRAFTATGYGLLLAGLPATIIGARFHYLVFGKRTVAVYVPALRHRFFIRREQCRAYRPKSKTIITERSRVRLAPPGIPWLCSRSDSSARLLNAWWPDLDSRAIQSEANSYATWSGASVFAVVAMLGIVMFVAALVFLAGGFAVRIGVLIGLAALALLVWLMEWHRRRCFEVALPGRDAG